MLKPEGIIQLRPREQVITVVREHFSTQVLALTIVATLYLLTMFLMYYLFTLGLGGVLAFACILLTLGFYTWRRYTLWQAEAFVITDQRGIDVARRGLFDTTVTEHPWHTVRDVHYASKGIRAAVFKYGSVIITLETNEVIVLQHVYQPARIRDIIAEYVPKLQGDQNQN